MSSFCRDFGKRKGVEIDFRSDGLPSRIPQDTTLCLFRVLQEALHNAEKYSGVRQFDGRLWGTSDEIHLTVSDCGVGFDLETAKEGRRAWSQPHAGAAETRERNDFQSNRNPSGVSRFTLACLSVREPIPCVRLGRAPESRVAVEQSS